MKQKVLTGLGQVEIRFFHIDSHILAGVCSHSNIADCPERRAAPTRRSWTCCARGDIELRLECSVLAPLRRSAGDLKTP